MIDSVTARRGRLIQKLTSHPVAMAGISDVIELQRLLGGEEFYRDLRNFQPDRGGDLVAGGEVNKEKSAVLESVLTFPASTQMRIWSGSRAS